MHRFDINTSVLTDRGFGPFPLIGIRPNEIRNYAFFGENGRAGNRTSESPAQNTPEESSLAASITFSDSEAVCLDLELSEATPRVPGYHWVDPHYSYLRGTSILLLLRQEAIQDVGTTRT